jgi:ferrochelatase
MIEPDQEAPYDSLLVVSFGGPEGPEEVLPFLENVLRGRNVPRERMLEVGEHYQAFGGKSPINDQNRALIAALGDELEKHGPRLPIYWGNRNWHPLLADTIEQMRDDGRRKSLAFFTSAYSSYSGCRQYRENILEACTRVGPESPVIHKLRAFYNHPGFVSPMIERVREAIAGIPDSDRGRTKVFYTAHSIPTSMSDGCDYVLQLQEATRLVSEALDLVHYDLVFQSRSGPPQQPWLEPDICDAISSAHTTEKIKHAVIVPIGFISDHMEVLFDLDTEARERCESLGIQYLRAGTVGTHPEFVSMIRKLILERTEGGERETLGSLGPRADFCPENCCPPPPARRP